MADLDDTDDPPLNNTLDGLLRKLEDGRFINESGAELQEYIKLLRMTAKKRGKRVVGTVKIELKIPMGVDGYMLPQASMTTKPIGQLQRPESVIYTDEDGDINGLPVAKQTTIFEVSNGKNKNPAPPGAKSM